MASSSNSLICIIILLITSFKHVYGSYESIISFGDSLADTGNLIRLSKSNKIVASSVLPYGETFFHHPTGRFSDGRLVIDFIGCKEYLENSLFLMGEIGGNDYNHPFSQGKSGEEVKSFVPAVISAIGQGINELIELGAQTLIVPGNLPIGCSASYLTIFKNSNKKDYDNSTGCINWLNEFAEYHNQLLQQEIHKLREIHPHANIIYADYYNAAMQIYKSPKNFGFTSTIVACCGGGGVYNYDSNRPCGSPSSNYCDTPSSYVSWDGVHLTEAAYKLIAKGLLQGPYTIPQMNYGLYNKGISDQ